VSECSDFVHPRVPLGDRIRRHGHVLLPVVLIALGLYILSGAFD
jgi:cadmium resistance protein CadD (predicted permease)